jgi:glutamine synthetase
MNPRNQARLEATRRKHRTFPQQAVDLKKFGILTFNKKIMAKMLPKEVYQNLVAATEGKERINSSYAGTIAQAMQDWAKSHGATHFTHWFQPMTGLAAEKQDAFLDMQGDMAIEKFSGKQLLRGEPDASSFPSGGLRSTSEARGYTSWDPSTPAFLWSFGGSIVLCIPSVFFSWTGQALDMKIPLLRSDAKINDAAMRLLRLLKIDANYVYSTLGAEQEYFLIDRAFYELRPDLVLSTRTVYGAAPAKTQELEDHYFGTMKERVIAFMQESEAIAFELGIPLKTRHAEVAPQQFEAAPMFEKASIAVDHNLLLMQLMKEVAARHDLSCLFHEKPFAGINGSGKHNNWSLSTDTGLNLLDPTDKPHSHLLFIIMLTAILSAVQRHASLLRASIASAANDHRLGGHEAPPVIISVYLGATLEKVLDQIEQGKTDKHAIGEKMDLRIPALPELPRDSTDRNRTSPFAFTGNKFEFRAVGSSANCSLPITVLNVIVAESLNEIVTEIENTVKKGGSAAKGLAEAALTVVRKHLKASRAIRFMGDNYSESWRKEAKKRGLPMIAKSFDAFAVFKNEAVKKVFTDVLSKEELASRYEVLCEHYSKIVNIEAGLMVDMFRTQILPAAIKYQKNFADSLLVLRQNKIAASASQQACLKKLSTLISRAINEIDALELARQKALALHGEKRGDAFCHKVAEKALQVRWVIDEIEKMVDDSLWPLPKYREMLFTL